MQELLSKDLTHQALFWPFPDKTPHFVRDVRRAAGYLKLDLHLDKSQSSSPQHKNLPFGELFVFGWEARITRRFHAPRPKGSLRSFKSTNGKFVEPFLRVKITRKLTMRSILIDLESFSPYPPNKHKGPADWRALCVWLGTRITRRFHAPRPTGQGQNSMTLFSIAPGNRVEPASFSPLDPHQKQKARLGGPFIFGWGTRIRT